jgi:hypothetical protein
MRSLSEKSRIDLTCGFRVESVIGMLASAEMPFTSFCVPLVRAHSVISAVEPTAMTSTLPENSASNCALGPVKVW